MIGAYHKCVAGTVARFDGFVAKYMGDGALIYFGYPYAHEDDAERAVRAGLGGVLTEIGDPYTVTRPVAPLAWFTPCSARSPGAGARGGADWGGARAARRAGGCPVLRKMVGQLRGAGYRDVQAIRLTPSDSFHAFRARLA